MGGGRRELPACPLLCDVRLCRVADVKLGVGNATGRTGGQGDQIVGRAKAELGNLTGNREMQAQSEAQQGKGQVKEGLGNLKKASRTLTGTNSHQEHARSRRGGRRGGALSQCEGGV